MTAYDFLNAIIMPDKKIKIAPGSCDKDLREFFSTSVSSHQKWRVSDFLPEKMNTHFRVAAPSWVIPATVAKNCDYLDGRVDEVCLLLFETGGCLAYTEQDLPSTLVNKRFSYHTHLPLDLDWNGGAEEVFGVIEKLVNKVAFLDPGAHVLHPPLELPLCRQVLPDLAELMILSGMKPSSFLLENIRGNDLCSIIDVIDDCGFGICFDLGHVLAHSQDDLLRVPGLWERVDMVHLNAPGRGARHESLDLLDEKGVQMMDTVLEAVRPGTVITIEVFDERGFVDSLAFLGRRLLKTGGI